MGSADRPQGCQKTSSSRMVWSRCAPTERMATGAPARTSSRAMYARAAAGRSASARAAPSGSRQPDRCFDQVPELVEVTARGHRQLVEAAGVTEILLPARNVLVDRPGPGPPALRRRRPVDPLAVDLVGDADANRVDAGQHVDLRERQPVDARERHRLAHEDRVEPAAAARAPGGRAVLVAVGT